MGFPTMNPYPYPIALHEAFGVELEYMIVDADTLDVRPICDQLLDAVGGEDGEARPLGDDDPIAWCNELCLHVVELKTAEPAPTLDGLATHFQRHVTLANEKLAAFNAKLLPGGAHPWMDPHTQMKLWPGEAGPIYAAFHRIFDCRGHGWANLQSAHLNLPFANDEEFGRLHAAIRIILPLLPGLAASTPVMDAKLNGVMDRRVAVYRTNATRVPSVAGDVIPEPVFTRHDYEHTLLASLYRDIAPHDPDGTLQHEWLNARGAIARFMRGSIEVRLLDLQECPAADLAIVRLVAAVVRMLTDERFSPTAAQQALPTATLAALLHRVTADAERAIVDNPALLEALGLDPQPTTVNAAWRTLAQQVLPPDDDAWPALRTIFDHGPLARRLVNALGPSPRRDKLHDTYDQLADALANGEMFGH